MSEENHSAPPPPGGGANELATVLGGEEVEVTYRDGSKECVFVRQISVRDMEKYMLALDNEPAAVELFCQRDSGWSDKLTPESFDVLAEKGQELNLPFFGPWLRRRMKRMEIVKPGFSKTVESLTKSAIESALQSHGSSPPPA